ncbi:MAG: hypothetical protein ACR2K6_10455, partial [Solirubrobacterales bacterium]
MDTNNISTGEKIAAAAGVVLILVMFIFDWYSVGGGSIDTGAGTVEFDGGGVNAWQAFGLIDLILFISAGVAIALAVMSANSQSPNLPVALSAIVAGLGILATLLVLYRILDVPGPGGIDRGIGVFLGLLAAVGIAYGGWTAMQEEDTSFGDQADRLQNRGGGSGGGTTGGGTTGGGRLSIGSHALPTPSPSSSCWPGFATLT